MSDLHEHPISPTQSLDALRMLCDVARICNQPVGLSRVAIGVLRSLCRFGDWYAGRVYVQDDERGPRLLVTYDDEHRPTEQIESADALDAMADLLLRDVMLGGEAIWQRTEFPGASDRPLTAVCAPVVSDERVLGAIVLVSESRPPPLEEVRAAVESAAIQFGGVIERRRSDRNVAEAASAEQARIGRDLHDSLSQDLIGLALSGEGVSRRLRETDPEEARSVERLTSGIRRVIAGLRDIVEGLVPIELNDAGLASALERMGQNAASRQGMRFEFRSETTTLGEDVARELYFIGSEALRNATKHADARSIRVELTSGGGSVRLEVSDDGKGIPASTNDLTGRGLAIMRHRASMIDGQLTIESDPETGTLVRCEAPSGRSPDATRDRTDDD